MGIEENEDVVRRFVDECVNTHREDLLPQFVTEGVTMYPATPDSADPTKGIDELRAAYRRFRVLLPDRTSGRNCSSAKVPTSSRAGRRPAPTPASWRASPPPARNSAGGTDIYRIEDGRIVEWWRNDDFVGLVQRLSRRVV